MARNTVHERVTNKIIFLDLANHVCSDEFLRFQQVITRIMNIFEKEILFPQSNFADVTVLFHMHNVLLHDNLWADFRSPPPSTKPPNVCFLMVYQGIFVPKLKFLHFYLRKINSEFIHSGRLEVLISVKKGFSVANKCRQNGGFWSHYLFRNKQKADSMSPTVRNSCQKQRNSFGHMTGKRVQRSKG